MAKSTASIYCPLRKIQVAALPEELVRQTLIQKMIGELGYPIGNMGVEISLSHLPHLMGKISIPKRRADLIVFGKDVHPQHSLYPLLLIECKAIPLTSSVLRQIVGYNHFVEAFYVGVANQISTFIGWYESNDLTFRPDLPPYDFLLEHVRIRSAIPTKNPKMI